MDLGRKRNNERTSSLPQAKRSPLNERCSEYQSGKVSLQEIAKEWWDKYLLRNNSEIVNIFHGQVRVQITCSKGHVTQMFEAISQLTLPIPQTSGAIQSTPDYQYGNNMHKNSEYSTLYDCLELYTQKKKTSR